MSTMGGQREGYALVQDEFYYSIDVVGTEDPQVTAAALHALFRNVMSRGYVRLRVIEIEHGVRYAALFPATDRRVL